MGKTKKKKDSFYNNPIDYTMVITILLLLALGGLLATISIMGKFELWLIPIAILFICETLSVMIQVTSFKLTGKRVFKMSPIHHHFELSGWTENKVVIVFSVITLLVCIIGIFAV